MKPIEEQLPFMLKRYSDYWGSDEHDIDLASWLVDCVPTLIKYIYQLRGALGYSVPGHIKDHPEILNGIADALQQQLDTVKQENEQLKRSLESAAVDQTYGELEQGEVIDSLQQRLKQAEEAKETLTEAIQDLRHYIGKDLLSTEIVEAERIIESALIRGEVGNPSLKG